jgi:hypothetical protein
MKLINALLFLLLFVLAQGGLHAQEIIQRLDGIVLGVDEAQRLLLVEFEHPVSGDFIEKRFEIDDTTGFKHVRELGKLKQGDLVSVDYYDRGGEGLKARYIIHVPLKLAYTSRKEVAEVLFKINSKKGRSGA